MRVGKGLSVAALLGTFILAGCYTPRGRYESGMEVVRQVRLPDSDDVEDAFWDLDKAIELAKRVLAEDEDLKTPSLHDRTAYIIPLAHLAKAELHGRFNQVNSQEQECWDAIREAEIYLGAHVRRLQQTSANAMLFANYSVFFRREKVRRHAFTLLKESYRKAGEKDLESLMSAQIGFSDIYLRSPAAHGEEEYIRTIENSDWVKLYDMEVEGIGHGFMVALLTLSMAAAAAGTEMQKSQLQQQQMQTSNPALKADLQSRIMQLDVQRQLNMEQAMIAMQKMEEKHEATLEAIENRFRTTVIGALMATFTLIELSEEVKQLDAYKRLIAMKETFDNYVLQRGFDSETAKALVDLRTGLDELTRDLQQMRRSGSTPPDRPDE